jgi:rhomboid protease GluP
VKRGGAIDRLRQFPGAYSLIALTLLVFAAQMASSALLQVDLVLIYGAKINQAIAAGQIWRLLSPLFVHAGLWHVLINMYMLYALGPAVERYFGTPRFLAVYLAAGMGGVALSLAMSQAPSVGASGAIFGLLGALVAFLFAHRPLLGQTGMLQVRQLILVALINLGIGLMPGIDNWGHLGGLLSGVSLAALFGPKMAIEEIEATSWRLRDLRPWREVWPGIASSALLLAALGLAASIWAHR